MHRTFVHIGIFLCLVAVGAAFGVQAQTSLPDIILSWQAQTYVPTAFPGKALPIPNSLVVMSVDMLQGGKFVDLSSQSIEWYVNEEPFRAGRGLRQISVGIPNLLGNRKLKVGVRLPDYGDGFLGKTVEITSASPKIVVESPYPKNRVGVSFSLFATPYFFNIVSPLDLAYSWKIAGVPPTSEENPRLLSVMLPAETVSGVSVPVFLVAKNKASGNESAIASVLLTKD